MDGDYGFRLSARDDLNLEQKVALVCASWLEQFEYTLVRSLIINSDEALFKPVCIDMGKVRDVSDSVKLVENAKKFEEQTKGGGLINYVSMGRFNVILSGIVSGGDIELARWAIEVQNAKVNIHGTQDRLRPLHEAAYKGDHEMIRLLMQHGADMHIGEQEIGCTLTPLQVAARFGNVLAFKTMIAMGSIDGKQALGLHNYVTEMLKSLEAFEEAGWTSQQRNYRGEDIGNHLDRKYLDESRALAAVFKNDFDHNFNYTTQLPTIAQLKTIKSITTKLAMEHGFSQMPEAEKAILKAHTENAENCLSTLHALNKRSVAKLPPSLRSNIIFFCQPSSLSKYQVPKEKMNRNIVGAMKMLEAAPAAQQLPMGENQVEATVADGGAGTIASLKHAL